MLSGLCAVWTGCRDLLDRASALKSPQPGGEFRQEKRQKDLVLWEDLEGAGGEGGGREDRDGEDM